GLAKCGGIHICCENFRRSLLTGFFGLVDAIKIERETRLPGMTFALATDIQICLDDPHGHQLAIAMRAQADECFERSEAHPARRAYFCVYRVGRSAGIG